KDPDLASDTKLFGARIGPRGLDYHRVILSKLARRAYRRPVTDQEVDGLVRLFSMVEKDTGSFPEGLCFAIQKILISPHFLFRVEKTSSGPLSSHELAA